MSFLREYEESYYVNRTLCDVLSDMRKCHKSRNYAALPGLIEEAQIKGNRMESGLSDKKDLDAMSEEHSRMKKVIKKLRKKRDKLKGKKK